MSETPKRYHPVFVVVHWLTALLIFVALFVGKYGIRGAEDRGGALQMHVFIGGVAVSLFVLRILLRYAFKRPADANTGGSFMEFAGKAAHILFYVGVIGVGVTGYILFQSAGLAEVFNGAAYPKFRDFPIINPHRMIGNIVFLLIFLHIGAVGYHQSALKDNIISRMWFGER